MDVKCLQCSELWDTYHIRHDALFEPVPWSEQNSAAIRKWDGKLDSLVLGRPARTWLGEDGWAFGISLYDVRRCPCCPADAVPATKEQLQMRETIATLLGDDDDGLAVTLNDFGL